MIGAPSKLELPLDVTWSIDVQLSTRSEPILTLNPRRVCATASVGKVLLLLAIADAINSERIPPDTRVVRAEAPAVADSGMWQHLRTASLPVTDLCALVGATSDNWATNALIEAIGLESVTAIGRRIGMTQTQLLDIVREDRSPTDPPALSMGSAAELRQLCQMLHTGEAISPAVSKQVRGWLALNTDLSMVAASFGLDPLAHIEPDRGFLLWNKTGTNDGVRGDVGVVGYGSETVSYAVLANWSTVDLRDSLRDEVLAAMHAIGDLIRSALAGKP
ncbi:MAG: serine hydrolase [Actinomycetes bacterium]